jgi:hypothetical protein
VIVDDDDDGNDGDPAVAALSTPTTLDAAADDDIFDDVDIDAVVRRNTANCTRATSNGYVINVDTVPANTPAWRLSIGVSPPPAFPPPLFLTCSLLLF